jgi:hypothetical protein
MPGGIGVPVVPLEVDVLRCRIGLDDAPIAIQHVLLALDELPGLADGRLIHRIRRHGFYRLHIGRVAYTWSVSLVSIVAFRAPVRSPGKASSHCFGPNVVLVDRCS